MRKEINLMQVLRVPPMGRLVVEMNKQRYRGLAEVKDENVRRLLLAAIGELVTFAGGYDQLVAAGVAPEVSPAKSVSQGASETAQPSEPSIEEQQAAFLASLEAERDALRAKLATPRQPSMLRPVTQTSALSEPADATGERSIVEQIDAILQRHLAADSEMAQRSIHLEQDPAGGLRIKVDGRYFQKPADIKETKIQVYIKRSLKEWESS